MWRSDDDCGLMGGGCRLRRRFERSEKGEREREGGRGREKIGGVGFADGEAMGRGLELDVGLGVAFWGGH